MVFPSLIHPVRPVPTVPDDESHVQNLNPLRNENAGTVFR
jgi:hypothetical protein